MSNWDKAWRATILGAIIAVPSALILMYHIHY